jgi:integrase/recombinase XerD
LRMYILDMDKELATTPTVLAPVAAAAADQHPVAVYLARLSPGSRRAMRQVLGVVADLLSSGKATIETFPWAALRYQHTRGVRAVLAERYSPATANKALSALRGVLGECFRLGLVSAENYARSSDLPSVRGESAPRGRALKTEELVALFGACDPSTAQGARDAGLLAVLYGAGLRRAEVVALDISDFDPESGELRIRSGKGRKPRTVWITNGARDALRAWLEVRGAAPGPLFLAVGKGGDVRPGRMTTGAVYQILTRLQAAAKVKPFSPHDCRRSYITALLAAGNSIAVVQKLAGHASVNTTARYDRSDEDAKRKAAETLHVPFAG